MNKVDGGILAARGFKAGTAAAGIKAAGGPDLALVWSETEARTAALFTKNSVVAAPVQLSRSNCQDHDVRAIVVNSGNANCMTGTEGRRHAGQMAEDTARLLHIRPEEVLVASTGIIGKPLPIEKVRDGIKAAFSSQDDDVAKAIMTTDTYSKSVAYSCEIGGKTVLIGGCAKGSGMIEPNMATMLAFLTTDAVISRELLDKALRDANRTTFNSITVDGSMSTNDTVSLTANGQAGNPDITEENEAYEAFVETLRQACLDLALMVVRDGEGATMLVTVNVKGAADYDQAKEIGYAVANSLLVKTAAHGKTTNWGRIAQAAGTLGLDITEDSLDMNVESPADDALDITLTVRLGDAEATVYTCDLSKDYVDINVEYN
ncbi:MAG TPA: bifunctional glutamate N-acetyltransferase/amino-acid acetyltransferase ArgJ [Candidatus Saccharimonadales bacterium]|nr:bifunctional glutamate N-acetyltransferase/amino-acid acetyltransferase ArgJ [Candidatus Saccharimonadales bacterium]